MVELSIDTSTQYAFVALSQESQILQETTWCSKQNHSVEVLPALITLMSRSNITVDQITSVFVAKGPGGFSALRVGVSIAKTFADAREIPLVAIGTLEIEAQPYLRLGLPVCVLMKAGSEKLYVGRYDGTGSLIDQPYSVETHEELIASISEVTVFCGEGVSHVEDLLREKLNELAFVVSLPLPTRRPSILTKLGYARLLAFDTDDVAELQPDYMRGSQFNVAQKQSLIG